MPQGEPLSIRQEDVTLRGHAIECRINAEDVGRGFLPVPGLITAYEEPSGPGVRVDSGIRAGDTISELYDPMIAKLIVHDINREAARRKMLRALGEFRIEGLPTLLPFHMALLTEPRFIAGDACHGLVESAGLAERAEEFGNQQGRNEVRIDAATPTGVLLAERRSVAVEIDGEWRNVHLVTTEAPWAELGRCRRMRSVDGSGAGSDAVVSPMQGTILVVRVSDGDTVTRGQVICVVESMKMENEVTAHKDGVVAGLTVAAGEGIASGQLICTFTSVADT